MITYNGLAYTQTVFGAYSGGKISGRDASSLLNVKLNGFFISPGFFNTNRDRIV